jgi:hypothetical protein
VGFFFLGGGAGVLAQGFMLARQVLYHLNCSREEEQKKTD